MKFKFSFRWIVIILFLVIYIFSLIGLNSYFNKQQNIIKDSYAKLSFDEDFGKLKFQSHQDSLLAIELLNQINNAKMSTGLIINQTKIYSTAYLIIMMFIAIIIFTSLFFKLTNPLRELQDATAKIREGDFSVYLPETGLTEMRLVKQSFNEMSRELENIQNKLLESEKQIIWKEISRVLAHEIKNPLTPIQLSIQRLEDKYASDPDKFYEIFPESAKMIYTEIDNLRNLVQSFSNFAKINTPTLTELTPFEVVTEIVKPYLHSFKIEINIPNDIKIYFDKTHFYQIVTNLLQNAMDATETTANALIKINLNISNSYYILDFIDNGCGIPEENLSRIFEPYFSKKKRGTGLGLALVKRLVDINHSYIRVMSKEGEGTTFEVIIPQNNS